MKIALLQYNVKEQKEDNIKTIQQLIQTIDIKQIDCLVLPEMFATPYENKYFIKHQEHRGGYLYNELSKLAASTNTIVIGGTFPEVDENKLYNTCFIFDQDGYEITSYRKMHLFSIEYPNGKTFSEEDTLTKGDKLTVVDTPFGTIGLMICFDIRFPELSNKLQQLGAEIIIVPGAFNTYTGPMHWKTTFQSRAIDHQVYMVGCSPARDSFGNYKPYGHSLVVNPYGEIVDALDQTEGVLVVSIDLDMVKETRRKIPIIKNKRDDLQ